MASSQLNLYDPSPLLAFLLAPFFSASPKFALEKLTNWLTLCPLLPFCVLFPLPRLLFLALSIFFNLMVLFALKPAQRHHPWYLLLPSSPPGLAQGPFLELPKLSDGIGPCDGFPSQTAASFSSGYPEAGQSTQSNPHRDPSP